MSTDLTVEDIRKALPANLRTAATQELTDKVNNVVSDPLVAQQIRDNFVGFVHILKDGKFKTEDYLHAVAYVSFKLMGLTNKEAYELTFPQRMHNLVAQGCSSKEIAAYVSSYARGKLVNLIYEQSMIPTWVLNQDSYQEAINTQVSLMRTSGSDLVRTQAANSLLTHLKKPEVKEFQISMETKENSGMRELQDALRKMAEAQLASIDQGTPTKLIAAQPIVEADYEEVDADQTKP